MMQKRYLPIAGICLLAFLSSGQKSRPNLPVVDIKGKHYYIYEAKKNQTFFNIASTFNWDLDELMSVNSKVMSPMEKGTKIYYPVGKPFLNMNQTTETGLENGAVADPVSHLVKKGETVYSISKMYSVPVDAIYSLNPGSRKGIKAGEVLRIRETGVIETPGVNPEFYVVKSGDTLYQLARNYNTTVASILKINPGISEKNFKAGSTIKLPGNGEGLQTVTEEREEVSVAGFTSYKVEKHDTWDSISSKTGVSVEDLKSANKNIGHLKNKQILGVPELVTDTVMATYVSEDPRELTINGVGEIYSDVHKMADTPEERRKVKIGVLVANPSSRLDMDFTRGFITGLNRLKNKDYSVTFKVFDGRSKEDALIDSLAAYEPKLLFTTYDKNTPEFLADYALVSQTPVVNTFDLKDEHYLDNPYFINILTPSNYFNEEIANNVKNRLQNSTLIVVGTESETEDLLLNTIEEKWDNNKIFHVTTSEALSEFPFKEGESYVVFGNVSGKESISGVANAVAKLKEENYNLALNLIGRPNWLVFDETLSDEFHKADVLIPARFYFDKNSPAAKSFLYEYTDLFKMTPGKSFPMYSTMGFDEAIYFIPSLVASGGDINVFKGSFDTVQSDFELQRTTNWSGMINPMVYLVRFSPFGMVEKIKIK